MGNKSPLVLPAVSWTLGLVFAKIFNLPFLPVSLIFILFSLLLFIKNIRTILILILIFLLAILRWNIHSNLNKNNILNLLKKRSQFTQPIEGKIISEVKKNFNGFRFTLKLIKIKNYPTSGKIIFYTYQQGLEYGDIIECTSLIKNIDNSANPGNFDYKEYLFSKGIYAKGYSKSYIKLIGYKPNLLQKYVLSVRKFIRKRINDRFFKYSNFTKAIVIAEKKGLSDWKNSLTKSGLSHLLAVSGLHIAIITLIIFTLFKIFILNRYVLYSLMILVLLFYGFITSFPPSVMRAVTMIILYFIAKMFQRRTNPNNILSATLIITTAIEPYQLFSAGFQMSFFAVFTLFNIGYRLNLSKYGKIAKISGEIFIIMLYSFLLNLSLSPITMYHFHTLNMNGVFSNIFGIPMLGFILPLAIIVIFLPYPVFIPFQYSYYFLMTIFEKLVHVTMNFPFNYTFIKLSGFRFFILIVLVFIYLSYKKYFKKLLGKIAFMFLILFIVIAPYKKNNNLKIIFFDTGSGEMSLIQTPNKKNILIDCGLPDYSSKRFERTALPYLKKNGITTLEKVIITAPHNEYYGGLKSVINNINVKELIISDYAKKMNFFDNLMKENSLRNCKITAVSDSLNLNENKTEFHIINPISNKGILIVKLNYGYVSTLFISNLEKQSEFLKNTDIIKVSYQSIKNPKIVAIIRKISPKIVFTSLSKRKRVYLLRKSFNFIKNGFFLSSKDGALVIDTNGHKIKYHTLISEKQGEIYCKEK